MTSLRVYQCQSLQPLGRQHRHTRIFIVAVEHIWTSGQYVKNTLSRGKMPVAVFVLYGHNSVMMLIKLARL